MRIRSGRPRVARLAMPMSAMTLFIVALGLAASMDTMLSAGCDTTAQRMPAGAVPLRKSVRGQGRGSTPAMHKPGRLVLVSGDACVHGHKHASATCGEHTCDVAGGEGDAELLGLVALRLGLGHDILVQRVDDILEGRELHHRVGDLAAPQRHKRLEEAASHGARVTARRPSCVLSIRGATIQTADV